MPWSLNTILKCSLLTKAVLEAKIFFIYNKPLVTGNELTTLQITGRSSRNLINMVILITDQSSGSARQLHNFQPCI